MPAKELSKVRPDSQGRIPAKEKWLWENKTALQQVKNGLRDSAEGRVKPRGRGKKTNDHER